ncbi:MAG: glycosyltransferase [Nitrospirae bacterium]|nr:glycosyltransferase [Nitrospirota bacterium]
MKILMIAPQPFFKPRGTPFSVLERLKALSHLGHEVDLLTYHLGQDVFIPNVVIHRTPHIRFIKAIRIGPSLTKLFLDILLLVKAFRLLQKGRYNLIHAHEEASFFGVLFAKLFGIRHLYDMHSSLPQQLTLSNFQYTRFTPLIRSFEWLEQYVIKSTDVIITICPELEKHVKKVNGSVPQIMIEDVVFEEKSQAVSEEVLRLFRKAHSLDGKRVVLYTGNFEPYQGLDLLVASAERVLRKQKDVVFLLMRGEPDQVRRYQNWVRNLGLLPHFRFTGLRPHEEVPQAILLSHVLVSPRISGTNTPLKIYSYLQSGWRNLFRCGSRLYYFPSRLLSALCKHFFGADRSAAKTADLES